MGESSSQPWDVTTELLPALQWSCLLSPSPKSQGPFARFENCHLLSSFWDAFFHEMTLQTSSPNQHCLEKQPR